MTSYTQADLAMVNRHIALGERHIVQQEELLTLLQLKGLPTDDAEKLLDLFNEMQVEHQKHRRAIADALDELTTPLRGRSAEARNTSRLK